jgi:hypothetical protein
LAQSVQAADAHRAVEIAADRFLVWHHDRYRVQLVDQKATAAWQKLPRGRLIEELVSLGAGGAAGLISHSVTDAAGTHRDFDLMWFDSHGAVTAVVPVPDYVLGGRCSWTGAARSHSRPTNALVFHRQPHRGDGNIIARIPNSRRQRRWLGAVPYPR